jgi:hypothetical protein
MYVIRDRKTSVVLDIVQSAPGEDRAPEEVYPEFDPETMEFGKSEEPSIPAWFTIENGIVKAVDPPAERADARSRGAAKPVTPSLDELKASAIARFSALSFERRRALIPDYQLQNAALGVYDEQQTVAIRDTVKAFRDEFRRLKSEIEKVRSIKALKDVTPNFPSEVVAAEPVRSASEKPRRGNV